MLTHISRLSFGLAKPTGGCVAPPEWQAFRDTTIAAMFGSGFTVFAADGGWRDNATGQTIREPSMILEVAHDGSEEARRSPYRRPHLQGPVRAGRRHGHHASMQCGVHLMPHLVTIYGSWGDLLVHQSTGHVVSYGDNGKLGWARDDVGYHDILWFDPVFLTDAYLNGSTGVDILETAFVTDEGRYVPAMVWNECAWQHDNGEWQGDQMEIVGLLPDLRS